MQESIQPAMPVTSAFMSTFHHQVSREWGGMAFRGVLSVIFGILAIFWPEG